VWVRGGLVADGRVVRSAVVRLVVERGRVLGFVVHSAALLFLGEKFLDLPIVLLDANGEFEVFASN
jgi:hypothetical protein